MNASMRVFLRQEQVAREKAVVQPQSRQRINACYKVVHAHNRATDACPSGTILVCKK
jgi:hypothetical protein